MEIVTWKGMIVMTSAHIAIIGGGISGLCTAIALQKQGIRSKVYERRNTLSEPDTGIVLTGNAIRAFFIMGIGSEVLKSGIATDRCFLKSDSGEVIAEFDYHSPSHIPNYLFIRRSALIKILSDAIAPGTVHLDKSLKDFGEEDDEITLYFSDETTVSADYLIACDGADSIIRKKLVPGQEPFFSGAVCWRGVTDFTFSTDVPFTETWGSRGRFGIAPLPGNRPYWYAFKNASQEKRDLSGWSPIDLLFNFFYYHEPIQQILENTSPVNIMFDELFELEALERFHFGKILLIGDAAHLSLPNIGQGASQAAEEAVYLSKWISIGDSIEKSFAGYDRHRHERTKLIENEMKIYGVASQLNFPILCSARNKLLQWAPAAYHNDKLRKIVEIDGF
jgi:FAD-dependent urate hydroxylase